MFVILFYKRGVSDGGIMNKGNKQNAGLFLSFFPLDRLYPYYAEQHFTPDRFVPLPAFFTESLSPRSVSSWMRSSANALDETFQL